MTQVSDAPSSLSAEAEMTSPTRRPRKGILAGAVLSIVVVVAAVLFLWSWLSGGSGTGLDAPAGNFSTRITAAMVQGDAAEQMLQEGMGPGQLVPGSVVYVGRAQAAGGSHDLFTWREVPDPQMRFPGVMTCFGQFEVPNGGGGASCGGDDGVNAQPGLGWSSGGESNAVNIDNLPRGAAWIVADTDTGTRIVGNVVANVAFVSWPSEAGSPQSVQVLDLQHRVLWKDVMGG